MYNTPTPEAIEIIQQLQEDSKQHYRDHKTKKRQTYSVKQI